MLRGDAEYNYVTKSLPESKQSGIFSFVKWLEIGRKICKDVTFFWLPSTVLPIPMQYRLIFNFVRHNEECSLVFQSGPQLTAVAFTLKSLSASDCSAGVGREVRGEASGSLECSSRGWRHNTQSAGRGSIVIHQKIRIAWSQATINWSSNWLRPKSPVEILIYTAIVTYKVNT